MTTYNTYQAAKIANPECEIYQLERNGLFAHCDHHKAELVRFVEFDSAGIKCNPVDHCMTVEKFLAGGHKFVDGDALLDVFGGLIVVGSDYSVYGANIKLDTDDRRCILRAAALEGIKPTSFGAVPEKPRTKVEYVKVTDSIFDLRPDFEAGELFSKVNHARDYSTINNTQTLAQALHQSCCYRRIETPMTWQEELYDYLDSSCEMSDDFDDSFTIEIEGKPLEFNLNDDEFVDMCKFVASLNSVN